ncbi:MAG: succinate dehydrogenase [Rhodobacteraceae bacterium]|nr:succinate dehydrogenase [Paracoccaceae bacterium]
MRFGLVLCLALLSGCATVDRVTTDTTRRSAKAAINTVVADRAPGVNVEPISDCIIDNATRGELLGIASTAVTGITDTTVSTITEIAGRPRTLVCITKTGLGHITF